MLQQCYALRGTEGRLLGLHIAPKAKGLHQGIVARFRFGLNRWGATDMIKFLIVYSIR
jgi:hypothetical protein